MTRIFFMSDDEPTLSQLIHNAAMFVVNLVLWIMLLIAIGYIQSAATTQEVSLTADSSITIKVGLIVHTIADAALGITAGSAIVSLYRMWRDSP